MPLPHMINGVPHVLCQGCEAFVPITQQQDDSSLPDNGLILTLEGWYAGFFDTMPWERPESLLLCHDCAERVFDAVPALAKRRGLHSTVGDERCCNYWWTFGHDETNKVDTVVYGDGTSRPLNKDGTL